MGSVGATLAVSRELKQLSAQRNRQRRSTVATNTWMRPMLFLTFVSLPSSASMVRATRRGIQRAVENFNEAIRLGRAYDEA